MKHASLLVLTIAFLIAGCGQSGQTAPTPMEPASMPSGGEMAGLALSATEFAYTPTELTVQAGSPVVINFTNSGTIDHSLAIELPEDAGGEAMLASAVKAGESADLAFTAPMAPGEYEFYCPVDGHKDQGMVGKLIVTP